MDIVMSMPILKEWLDNSMSSSKLIYTHHESGRTRISKAGELLNWDPTDPRIDSDGTHNLLLTASYLSWWSTFDRGHIDWLDMPYLALHSALREA